MTTCLGKSCSFGLPCVSFVDVYVCSIFPVCIEGRMCVVIVSIPDNCLSIHFFCSGVSVLLFL